MDKMIKFLLFLSCFGLCWGWLPFLNPSEDNDCDMTFMYYQPNYMDVGFKYGNYGYNLWLYGEGWYAMNYMNQKKLGGIPVVFVPGNAGSGKQARSIGSLLHNKTLLRNTPFHFDTFTFDFNEEFSGLDSSALLREADYVEKGIQYIWTLYKQPPPGIIFIGHSMGGMVIKSVIGNPWFDLNRVAVVLTLSTPHARPPLPVDALLHAFWHDVDEAWNSTRITDSHVRLVSISSGIKDELIYEPLTKIERSNFYHFSSTSIDRVWVEADHKAVVWCNQLVRQNSRFIFEYAEDPRKFIANIDAVIGKHFDGPQRVLKPLKTSNVEAANVVAVTKGADNVVVALGKVSDSDIITNDKCRGVTRYLDSSHYFNVIENSECDGVQFLADKDNSMLFAAENLEMHVVFGRSFFSGSWTQFHLTVSNGLKKARLSLDYTEHGAVYFVNVVRSCPKGDRQVNHVFFRAKDGVRRFQKKSNGSSHLRIYSSDADPGYLYFIDADPCEYSVEIWLDRLYSLRRLVLNTTLFIGMMAVSLISVPAMLRGLGPYWTFVGRCVYCLVIVCVVLFCPGKELIQLAMIPILVTLLAVYTVSVVVRPVQEMCRFYAEPVVEFWMYSDGLLDNCIKMLATVVMLRCFPFLCCLFFYFCVESSRELDFTAQLDLFCILAMAVPETFALMNLVRFGTYQLPSCRLFVAAFFQWSIENRYPLAGRWKHVLSSVSMSLFAASKGSLEDVAIWATIYNVQAKTFAHFVV